MFYTICDRNTGFDEPLYQLFVINNLFTILRIFRTSFFLEINKLCGFFEGVFVMNYLK